MNRKSNEKTSKGGGPVRKKILHHYIIMSVIGSVHKQTDTHTHNIFYFPIAAFCYSQVCIPNHSIFFPSDLHYFWRSFFF
jgi:hypothetical protein